MKVKCNECGKEMDQEDAYEYYGAYACPEHIIIVRYNRAMERKEEHDAKYGIDIW